MAIDTTKRYCPVCGTAVTEPTYDRFGEWCCSEAHAEEHVAEVRARRQGGTSRSEPEPARPAERRRGGCC